MKKFLSCILLLVVVVIGLLTKSTLVAQVPEPAVMLLFGIGLISLGGIIKKTND